MLTVDTKNMEVMFGKMKEAELSIAGYYTACFEKDSLENKSFWRALSEAEVRHAGNMDKMLALIKKTPYHYYCGLDFDPVNIKELVDEAKTSVLKVVNLQLLGKSMLLTARNLEDRLLEKKYFETVKSEEKEFVEMLNIMKEETKQHREMLLKKLEAVK
ncbi:MAG: hypothetical protein A2231_00860 [Candidatus Firestonebacteria bacterium RIFOXYA2_FULL_40_8]|nr:MAG: hypothetical protein A2231_00860 [Candidatus Firestonebacteria bacterium RIFOXYA2_FULL_40_8]